MVPSGTEGAPEYPSYTWNLTSGSVTASDIYVSLDADTLPLNGEVVMSLSDSRFPNHTEAETGYPLTNTLQVYDPASSARYPFYSSTAGSLFWPRFIEGGERIVAGIYDSAASDRSWQVLERSGVVSGSLGRPRPKQLHQPRRSAQRLRVHGGRWKRALAARRCITSRPGWRACRTSRPACGTTRSARTRIAWVSDA
jgi:hypothetical protein